MTTKQILQSWVPSSWRADAFDPAYDYYEPDVAPARPVRRKPNLILHPGFFEDVSEGLHGDLDNWV